MEELDLKDLFRFYKARLAWIIIAVLACVAIGNLYRIVTRTPMYKSEATVLLVGANTVSVNELPEIVKSRSVLDAVISNLNLSYSYATLKRNVSATPVTNTKMIKISVSDKNPKLAAKIANETAEVFVKETKEIYKLSNIQIPSKAVESAKPYNLSFMKDNIMFVGIAIVLACGIIFVIYYFDTSVKSSSELENKLGFTIIGVVPKVNKE